MKNMINWFEIPVTDYERAKKFYETILDCKIETQEMTGYLYGFLPMTKGEVSGGIVQGDGYVPSMTGTVVYLNGDPDLTIVLGKVEAAGGKVLMSKTQITPEIGYMAFFTDSEGNKIALHSNG